MPRGRAISAGDSLGRKAWPWIVFDRIGMAMARGATRLAAQRRAERAEPYGHKQFLIAKNARTGASWVRLGGSWWPGEPEAGSTPKPRASARHRRAA